MFDNYADGDTIGHIRFDITKNGANEFPVDISMETELGWHTFVVSVMNGMAAATRSVIRDFIVDEVDDELPEEWLDASVEALATHVLSHAFDGIGYAVESIHGLHRALDGASAKDVDYLVAAATVTQDDTDDEDEEPEDG